MSGRLVHKVRPRTAATAGGTTSQPIKKGARKLSTVTTAPSPAHAAATVLVAGHYRIGRHVHDNWIDWPAIRDIGGLSHGEQILVDLAHDMYAGQGLIGRAIDRLDDANWLLVIDALLTRRPLRNFALVEAGA